MSLLESGENYLETILVLTKRNGSVRSIDIAEEMNFTKASVSRAMSILKRDNYIIMEPDGRILLTKDGQKKAAITLVSALEDVVRQRWVSESYHPYAYMSMIYNFYDMKDGTLVASFSDSRNREYENDPADGMLNRSLKDCFKKIFRK